MKTAKSQWGEICISERKKTPILKEELNLLLFFSGKKYKQVDFRLIFL